MMDFGWKTNAISKNGSHTMTFFTYTFSIRQAIYTLNFYLLVRPLTMNYMMEFLPMIYLLWIGFTFTILIILTFIYQIFKLFNSLNLTFFYTHSTNTPSSWNREHEHTPGGGREGGEHEGRGARGEGSTRGGEHEGRGARG
jgi:hypothetical protein